MAIKPQPSEILKSLQKLGTESAHFSSVWLPTCIIGDKEISFPYIYIERERETYPLNKLLLALFMVFFFFFFFNFVI